MVCPSCYDAQSGTCADDSPRSSEIAEAQAQQAVGVVKGIASALGITEAVRSVSQATQAAAAASARCPRDGTLAPAGTKFCPECGTAMVQPQAAAPAGDVCPKCGAKVQGAKFCPECGAKIERPAVCPQCGKPVQGAKFCPECGAKVG
jgi:membrane protease subunit (stomatin/prohibitin family)